MRWILALVLLSAPLMAGVHYQQVQTVIQPVFVPYIWHVNPQAEVFSNFREWQAKQKIGNLHRPDRVVFLPEERVVILDYKTGIPLDSHSRQKKRYVNLFKEMGKKHVEALLVYIERNEVVKV